MLKKIIVFLLAIFLLIPIIGIFKVNADDYYSYACGLNYEVSYINNDGEFDKVECYENYDDAVNKMHELGGDHVVRHYKSYSPTKIIAMNSGLAYTYPGRGGVMTMNIYEDMEDRSIYYKKTYVVENHEMNYIETSFYNPKYGVGYVHVVFNGFDGYVDLEYVDLVPSKFIDNDNITIWLGGKNTYSYEDPYEIKIKQNYYERVLNDNYDEVQFTYYMSYTTKGYNPKAYTTVVGPAYDFMEYGKKYYSNDNVTFYEDNALTIYAGTAYNYYQFLPLRSTTDISGNVFDRYLVSLGKSNSVMIGNGQSFVDAQNEYGVNALMVFAMACLESGYGTSNYAINRNNLFGWNAYDADPGMASYYGSVASAVAQHMSLNLRGYLDITDGRFFGSHVGNKGSGFNVKYASDPYWGIKIASIAYAVDKFANNKDGNLTDYNKYSLALINSFNIDFKENADVNSNTLYTSMYGDHYQENFTVITLGDENGFTKVQSTNIITTEGEILTQKTAGVVNDVTPYDFEKSVVYVESKYLTPLNEVNNSFNINELNLVNKEMITDVEDIILNDDYINISGIAAIIGYNYDDPSIVSHQILLTNLENGQTRAYNCQTNENDEIYLGDGFDYSYTSFNANIPLVSLSNGSYSLSIRVINGENYEDVVLNSIDAKYAYICKTIDNQNYIISCNELYNYRFELDVIASNIKFASVNKPTRRASLNSVENIELNEDGNLLIEGFAFMYGIDFTNQNNIDFNIYLVGDQRTIKMNTDVLKTDMDYSSLLNLNNKLDYIQYRSYLNIKNISGNYKLYFEIINGNYRDIFELDNRYNFELPSIKIEDKNYSLVTTDIRSSIKIVIGE